RPLLPDELLGELSRRTTFPLGGPGHRRGALRTLPSPGTGSAPPGSLRSEAADVPAWEPTGRDEHSNAERPGVAIPPRDFTIGVEEEYQIITPENRELRQRAGRILPQARRTVGDDVTNELYLSQIEIGTPVCRSLEDVRAELTRLRRELIAA